MTINLKAPELRELKPRIMVCGVGGAGGNAVNNMIVSGLAGVDFIVANTDAQALASSKAERIIQMGLQVTEGLGAGSKPEVGRAAAEEAIEEIRDHLAGAHMVFVTAGMGGGTGTGAAPVVARVAREMGILTVGVVTKPFQFEGGRRMRLAEGGIAELQKSVDTLIIIPNQNLFRVANEKTTFADAFAMADQVLYSGVACITDLMVKEGLINLDFADVRSIMSEMGKAMMGTGEASGDRRAVLAAEAAIANPLLDEVSMKGARGLLISITGGNDLTLYEVDEAASRIRQEVDEEANIILGATFDQSLDGVVRVSVVATGIDQTTLEIHEPSASQVRIIEAQQRLRAQATARSQPAPVAAEAPVAAQPAPSAAAPSAPDEVEIRPAAPKAVYAAAPAPRVEEPVAHDYIPPAPEQPVIRPARMPQIEDLPPVVQQQMRVHRGEQAAPAVQVETRRRSLLEKLAAFGISRHDEAPPAQAPRAIPPSLPAPAPQRPAQTALHAEYGRPQPRVAAPRPAQGSLDPHGRMAARPAALEEDQLEIPAFLRRQSN
ncbi:cell division protein FtsZ [Methylocapsa sp. S129]|uniref:cell division protein FtsZ n=1 Tax=Methylocapsa sp. S129 TaxID=1641869 RepID=UPI00131C38F2|nr:cell division protein FtsZ [Methylocapsa sp. S129]